MNLRLLFALIACAFFCASAKAARQAEPLNRGVVAIRTSTSNVYVSWRLLSSDPAGVGFNVYRVSGTGSAVKRNSTVVTAATTFPDTSSASTSAQSYYVKPVINGVEQAASEMFTVPAGGPMGYFAIPLQVPAGGTVGTGTSAVSYTYSANDCSIGDVDGDGAMEIILKWDPSNSKDNSLSGYTGNVYLDCYKLNGTLLWRIDLGVNIRAGAHYTQFMVYDLDGDGKAEVACKTAPGSKGGTGAYVGSAAKWQNANGGSRPSFSDTADYRNSNGYVLSGAEFFTVFNGQTGEELASTNYVPQRGTISVWGDTYGNRVDRFLACVAFLDGERPSVVMCRGYYLGQSGVGTGRTVLAAWDWRAGQLTQRWVFDTEDGKVGSTSFRGQGAHSLTVGDVDDDGKDEIVYGAACIDDNGEGLYSTGLGHGDALHMSDMDPNHPGLEVFMVHEEPGSYGTVGGELRDARTGQLLFAMDPAAAVDVGRGNGFDIDSTYPGYEMWTTGTTGMMGNIYNVNGTVVTAKPSMFVNFGVWWDGDLYRELLDDTTISDWTGTGRSNFDLDPGTSGVQGYATGCDSNNSTKATPCLSGDILGDWREEVIWRTTDSTALHVYSSTVTTTTRLVTWLQDSQYRLALAWQNVGYNQPPHASFNPAAPALAMERTPKSRYALDGNALDGSGNGNNGTANAVSFVRGKVGAQAAQFGGTNSYIAMAQPVSGDFSISFWAKTTDTGGTGQWYNGKGLIDGEIAGTNADFGTSLLGAKFGFGVGNTDTTIFSTTSINDGKWRFLTATRTGVTGKMRVYVDGILEATGAGSATARTIVTGTGLRIGSIQTGASGKFFNGTIDDVRVLNYVLTPNKIGAMMSLAAPNAPTSLTLAATSNTQVSLSWTPATSGTGYSLKRSPSANGTFTTIATLSGTSYTDPNLTPATTYFYSVSATNAYGESDDSAQISATTLSNFQQWQVQYFGSTTNPNAAANVDFDRDGQDNQTEFDTGTNPTNSTSLFASTVTKVSGGFVITWPSVPGKQYVIEFKSDLTAAAWQTLTSKAAAAAPATTTSHTDAVLATEPGRFYRVKISP